jgi:hypothetical protein
VKGGGLTWLGWLMVGTGGMLVYAGMTGQSLVGELSAVLNGRPLGSGHAAAPSDVAGPGQAPGGGTVRDHEQPHSASSRAVPLPIYGSTAGGRGEGGGR